MLTVALTLPENVRPLLRAEEAVADLCRNFLAARGVFVFLFRGIQAGPGPSAIRITKIPLVTISAAGISVMSALRGDSDMNPFTKKEFIALVIVILALIGVSTPNFAASIKRARDQVRRDDMGTLQKALSVYFEDFNSFPKSTPDGKIIACKNPGSPVTVDNKGRFLIDLIPCEWGKDSIIDLTPGGGKVYLAKLPGDPDSDKGVRYVYFSDGNRYQIYTSFEITSQAEYDPVVVARNINCGNRICNVGRGVNVPIDRSIEQYVKETNQ